MRICKLSQFSLDISKIENRPWKTPYRKQGSVVMSYYTLTIKSGRTASVDHKIKIYANNDDDCAEYIKTHVKKLYNPYFKIIVDDVIGNDELSEDEKGTYTSKFCLFLESLLAQKQKHDDGFFISNIRKYLKESSTKEVLSALVFEEMTGDNDDRWMEITFNEK